MRKALLLVRGKETKGRFTSLAFFYMPGTAVKVLRGFPFDLHYSADVAIVVPISRVKEPRLRELITCSRSYS